MATLYDADVTDDSADFLTTAGNVVRMTAVFTTLPTLLTYPDSEQPNHILRAGWLALGAILSDSGSPAAHWRNPLYINFTGWIWEPDFATMWADVVEWHIGTGGVVHLHIEG